MNVTVTTEQLHVIWSDAIPNADLPTAFAMALALGPGTEQERAEWRATIRDELRAAGLADDTGPHPDLTDACALLARPSWTIDAWLVDHAGSQPSALVTIRACGAANAETAVLATLAGDQIVFSGSSPHRLPADVVALTGTTPAANGRSISLPASALFTAVEQARIDYDRLDRDELIDRLAAHSLTRGRASTVAGILTTATRHGQFAVQRADRNGTLRPEPDMTGFVDTAAGRWAQLRGPGDDGSDWVTYTPAGTDRLTALMAGRLPVRWRSRGRAADRGHRR